MRKIFLLAFFAGMTFLPFQVAEQNLNKPAAIARAQELNRAGGQAIAKGDWQLGKEHYREAIQLLRSMPTHPEAAKAYRGLGKIAFWLGDFPRAESAWLKDVSIL